MSITELAIKRPSFIIVIFLALGMMAVFGYYQLGYELLPKIDQPYVTVKTEYPGASPGEVENNVTRLIEDALSGIEKVKNISSTSYEGLSIIAIEFYRNATINVAVQDVQRKVNEIISTLPKEVKTPSLLTYSVSQIPVLRLSLTSNLPAAKFYTLVDDQIKPRLSRVQGVGNISINGGLKREIKVNIDAQKVRSYGLSISQVANSINAANLDFPTGKLKDPLHQFVVRVAGKFTSLEEMNNLVVGYSKEGGEIRLRDIAEIHDATVDPTLISRFNGINALGLEIQKQNDANMVKVCELVKIELKALEADYKGLNLHFDIADDQSIFTMDAANAVMEDLMLAILLVAAVMFLFLHSVRTSLIVMVSIPCSLTTAFVVMWVAGMSLNLFTLLALSLVIGILVDDSIVVLENIYHHLEKGEDKLTASIRGRNEIGFAAISITFVDIVVFVPLALTTGLIGDIIRGFSIIILVSTLTSLLVSFTVTPILASRFAKLESIDSESLLNRFGKIFEKAFKWLTDKYALILGWSLRNPYKVLFVVSSGLIITLLIPVAGITGFEFMKQTDRSQFSASLEYAPGTTLENNNRQTRKIEKLISTLPEVTSILTNVGKGSDGISADNQTEIVVSLCDKNQRKLSTAALGSKVKELTVKIPGVKVYVNQISFAGGASSAPVQVEITGINYDSIMKSAGLVAKTLILTPGVTYLKFSATRGNPETRVDIDRQKMAALGLSVSDVGSALQVALTGNNDSKYRDGSNQFDIRVSLDKFDRTNPDDITHLSFISNKNKIIELQQFATIYQSSGPTKLERKNRNALTTVSAYTDGSPAGSIVQAFTARLGAAKAGGTTIGFGGDQEEMLTSFLSLFVALIAAVIFVYFIMVILYDSFIYPFVVLFSIPVALIGAILALALTGNTINVFSILGIIMMIGLVAKNAILIVDRANERRAEGETIYDALMDAGKMRIRPIFMTTFAMVFGMMPIAMAAGAGAEWKNGLAWALIGGLTSSMFLTLVVVPIIYEKVARMMEKRDERKRRKHASVPAIALLLLMTFFSFAGASHSLAQEPLEFNMQKVRIAMVFDGEARVNTLYRSTMEKEIKSLMAGQVEVVFAEPPAFTGQWSLESVKAINDKLLADKNVDIIVSLGVLATHDLCHRKNITKPVIAAPVLNRVLQDIPFTHGSSGINNLTYIQLKPSIENEFAEMKKIANFDNLSIVVSADYLDILNPGRRPFTNFDTINGVRMNLIRGDTSAAEIIKALPKETNAVYLEALYKMSEVQFSALIDSLNARKLPTFGFDQVDVEAGALASLYPRLIDRLSKRIALDIQQILLGVNASSLPVELLTGKGLFLNLGTFYKLGLKLLSWDILTEATIVDLLKKDTSVQFIHLKEVMMLALDSNRALVAKSFEVKAGAKNIDIARSSLLPNLGVYALGALNDNKNYQSPQVVSASGNISQSVYSEPDWANLKVTASNQQALEEEMNTQKLNIGNQVAKAYLNILESRHNFLLLLNNLMISRSNLDVSVMKKESGSVGENEVYRWQIEVAKSKKDVINSYSNMTQAVYKLLELIHVRFLVSYDLADVELETSGMLISDSGFFQILEDPIRLEKLSRFLVKEGIMKSPVIRQYDFIITAQEQFSRSANISRFIPNTTLSGGYTNRLYQTTPDGWPYPPPEDTWNIQAKVEIPLFTGLKNNATMQKARLTLAQRKSEKQSQLDQLESAIRSNLTTLMSDYLSHKQWLLAETAALRNLELVTNQYLLGKKNILDVLDAQQQYITSSMSRNSSYYALLKDYFALQESLGQFDYFDTDVARQQYLARLKAYMNNP
ncbi:MAG: efflux RND transporter permease subunit [Bacteroidetes bacterium]|nr:efflux RND transporter permease subunit [Bacteroidota bacterium]